MAEINWAKPSREADAWIAEHVFGETKPPDCGDHDRWQNEDGTWTLEIPDWDDEGNWMRSWTERPWPIFYTKHIAAAWEVAEKLTEREIYLVITLRPKQRASVSWAWLPLESMKMAVGSGEKCLREQLPLTICHAACLALLERQPRPQQLRE